MADDEKSCSQQHKALLITMHWFDSAYMIKLTRLQFFNTHIIIATKRFYCTIVVYLVVDRICRSIRLSELRANCLLIEFTAIDRCRSIYLSSVFISHYRFI